MQPTSENTVHMTADNFGDKLNMHFEMHAKNKPDAPAIIYKDQITSYKKLNLDAEALAEKFKLILSTNKNRVILISLQRDVKLIISIVAAIKANAIFVPIDHKLPFNWKRHIVNDVAPTLILCNDDDELAQLGTCIDSSENISFVAPYDIPEKVYNKECAYILYTSGTSGRPKGIAISHANALNLINWAKLTYSINELRSVLASTSISFDLSIFELFVPLSCGTQIYLLRDIFELLDESNPDVTLINTVPSSIKILIDNNKIPNAVQVINLAGEPLSTYIAKDLYRINTIEKVYNLYGPTETTTYSTFKLISRSDAENINIGKPILNTNIYIVDKNMHPVEDNSIGEICITGDGVSLGYINNNYTYNGFTNNIIDNDSRLLYKTGDLGRLLNNDEIELLGRIDNQVKINGNRVDLESIKSHAQINPLVKEACAIYSLDEESNRKMLILFISLKNELNKNERANFLHTLREDLQKSFPTYMIPSKYSIIDNIPHLINGKIDLIKLNQYNSFFLKNENETNKNTFYNHELKNIIEIWEKLLEHNNFEINTNFFDVGGDSILLVKLFYELQKISHNYEFKLVDLFSHTTISKMYSLISNISIDSNELNLDKTQLNNYIQNDCQNYRNSSIAIVGYACRLPGIQNIDDLWNVISSGANKLRPFTKDELLNMGVSPKAISQKDFIPVSGLLDNIYDFDNDFFGFSKNEALEINPQQRLFIELCYDALQHSGHTPEKIDGPIGIFAGTAKNEYIDSILSNAHHSTPAEELAADINSEKDYFVTRIAYKLGLTGPAININTACSSTLAAIVTGCQNLILNEADLALAGGVNIIPPHKTGYTFRENHIFSRNGICKPFDNEADGTLPSSGATVFVLKRLNDAIRDRDNIHAVIKGFAINNDGNLKAGYTAPSPLQQSECIKKAILKAGITADDISYIETHGTGTALGDTIEISSLANVFSNRTKKVYLGSIKANIGHTDAASGGAGLMKILAMFKNNAIPMQANFDKPSSKNLQYFKNFTINKKTKVLDDHSSLKYAGLSSFGIGGTNVHMILENFCDTDKIIPNAFPPFVLLTLSAKSSSALKIKRTQLAEYFESIIAENNEAWHNYYLHNTAYTLQQGHQDFHYRYACLVSNISEAVNDLLNLDNKNNNLKYHEHTFYHNLSNIKNKWLSGNKVRWKEIIPTNEFYKKLILPSYPYNKRHYSNFRMLHDSITPNIEHNINTAKITTEVQSIWSKILGVEPNDYDSDFFMMGGDSLLLLRLIATLERKFNISLSGTDFFKTNKLCDFINSVIDNLGKSLKDVNIKNNDVIIETDEKIINDDNEHIENFDYFKNIKYEKKDNIHIKHIKTGDSPTLIFIHPGNGKLLQYMNLVNHNIIKHNVYGIENASLHQDKSYNSIEEYSDYYINLINDIHFSSKFILVGWSFGGTIAYDMAAKLKSNKQLGGVILFDSWAEYPKSFDNDKHFNMMLEEENTSNSNDFYIDFFNTIKKRMNLLKIYKPKICDIPIVLFKAIDSDNNLDFPENLWSKYAKSMHIILVKGTHDSIFSKENIDNLTSSFKKGLNMLSKNDKSFLAKETIE